jgi:hypothetical protein
VALGGNNAESRIYLKIISCGGGGSARSDNGNENNEKTQPEMAAAG